MRAIIERMRKLIIILTLFLSFQLFSVDWLSSEEQNWLETNRSVALHLGFDPQAGMEYFTVFGRELGLMPELAELLEKSLDVEVIVESDMTWGEAYRGLQTGEVDILFGANITEERMKIMNFTDPLFRIPYSLLSRHNSGIFVVGDLEERKVAFIDGDIIMDQFPVAYSRINYTPIQYADQEEALTALDAEEVDAFITSGGIVIFDYLKQHPGIREITALEDFTSDMTLSVRKDREILGSILNKWIAAEEKAIAEMIKKVSFSYNYKIMELTEEEINWIENEGRAVVGVAEGYLPFEVIHEGEFRGISASIIREISKLTGIAFIPVEDDFNSLYERAIKGEVDVLNIAKTADREQFFHYTKPYSTERDIIYGRKESSFVQDIYGLKNRKVAIVDGYWHKELLEKNAIDAVFVITGSLEESMEAVLKGRADYMIENPSVMKYFIQEMELYELTERGMTSYNSFLYFGITKDETELASIMEKSLRYIDLEKAINVGYDEVPHRRDRKWLLYLSIALALLLLTLALVALFAYRQSKDLMQSRKTTERLKEREELMYRDSMTQLYNRHYLYHKVEPVVRKWKYPQTVIIWDLNNLKKTNDKWGHDAGDMLLSRFGSYLREGFSPSDTLIRMGGDEFMIISAGSSEEDMLRAADILNERMENEPLYLESGERIHISSAWGMAMRKNHGEKSFEELQKEADAAMYTHKKEMKDSSSSP